MGGLDLHRRLRDSGCRLPIILISAYLNAEVSTCAANQGVFRILQKPYRNNELAKAVREAIEQDRTSRQPRADRPQFEHRLKSLNARERLTLEMILTGSTNRTIERRIGLSTRSVDRIRCSILQKMGYLSFVELAFAYGMACVRGGRVSRAFGECEERGIGDPVPGAVSSTVDARDLHVLRCDLHDRIAHYVAAALMQVRAVEARQEIVEDARALLRESDTHLFHALAEIRDIVAGRPSGLKTLSGPFRAGRGNVVDGRGSATDGPGMVGVLPAGGACPPLRRIRGT
jgi:hypothetical protein